MRQCQVLDALRCGCFKPDIFNTDQDSQFISFAFTNTLKEASIRISMDGRGRWMDNVFIERLWRTITAKEAEIDLQLFTWLGVAIATAVVVALAAPHHHRLIDHRPRIFEVVPLSGTSDAEDDRP